MMEKLITRGEQLAREAQARQVGRVAGKLRSILGGRVYVEGSRVLLHGAGIVKRWLVEPSLRFLGGQLK